VAKTKIGSKDFNKCEEGLDFDLVYTKIIKNKKHRK
jgi:hypothetical protein